MIAGEARFAGSDPDPEPDPVPENRSWNTATGTGTGTGMKMTTYPLPDLSSLTRELKNGAPGLAVGGVVPGARALAMAAVAAHGWPKGLGLIVVPHVAEAENLAAGCGC